MESNDSNIRVWRDSWVSRYHNYYLDTPLTGSSKEFKVFRLINEDGTSWNMIVLSKLLISNDFEAILRILLSITLKNDANVWHFTKNEQTQWNWDVMPGLI